MPPQRIYNVFCLNVSPRSVQRASVVFAFQCLLVWVVEMLPLRHGLAEKGRLQERQLQNCFEMLQNKYRKKCKQINSAALGTFQAFEIHPLRCFQWYLIFQRLVYLVEPGKLPRDFILFWLVYEHLHHLSVILYKIQQMATTIQGLSTNEPSRFPLSTLV